MKYVSVAFLALVVAASAGVAAEPAGQQWAVLISVARHDDPKIQSLSFTVRDAQALRRTLTERAGIPSDHILEMTDDSDKEHKPTLANLRRELRPFLGRAGNQDRVLVYFSGHGFLDQDKAYLVPSDLQYEQAAKTGLPAAEVRQLLADCKAEVKFLILDCCHAGGAKDVKRDSTTPEALAKSLQVEKLPGIVVLAACKDDESSWEWPEREQGLFTYWLCRALEGGADKDGDGKLSADEVYDYVQERVSRTALVKWKKRQSPVRIIGGDVVGVPLLLALRPETPETVCRRLAEHLDLEVRARPEIKRVGVLECLVPLGEVYGLPRSTLPAYCTAQLQAALEKVAGKDYEVAGVEKMRPAAKSLKVEAVGNPLAMRRLGKDAGVDAVVLGILRPDGLNLALQCELTATADGKRLATPSGLFALSEELVADNGASFSNRQRPSGSPVAPEVVNHALEQSQQSHPLLEPDFPFKVEVWSVLSKPGETPSATTPRKKKDFLQKPLSQDAKKDREQAQRDLLIPARSDELFELRVWNNTKTPVGLELLIDGINTIDEKRERLGKAKPWVLDPTNDPKKPHVLDAWHLSNKTEDPKPLGTKKFTAKWFQFGDVSKSVAGRENFTESLGLITLAFYAERGRAVFGVGEGPEEQRQLQTVDFKPGRLLGVVQIRYMEESEYKKLAGD
jgi:hypothetical protein